VDLVKTFLWQLSLSLVALWILRPVAGWAGLPEWMLVTVVVVAASHIKRPGQTT